MRDLSINKDTPKDCSMQS